MCKIKSCDTVGFHCFMYIYRSNVMAVMHAWVHIICSGITTENPEASSFNFYCLDCSLGSKDFV